MKAQDPRQTKASRLSRSDAKLDASTAASSTSNVGCITKMSTTPEAREDEETMSSKGGQTLINIFRGINFISRMLITDPQARATDEEACEGGCQEGQFLRYPPDQRKPHVGCITNVSTTPKTSQGAEV